MNNHHEYTIFDENGAFFRGQGGGAEDLARLVAVGDPFEVVITGYSKKQKVLRQTTVQVADVCDVIETWIDQDDFLKIDRITYKIAPAYLNRWVDVSSCDRKPVPHGTKFLWEVNGYSIARELTFELPKFKHWGLNRTVPGFGVTSIFIPEYADGFYPLSFTPAWAAEPKKADQKSSSQTVSANHKAEVQSDICPECGNYDGEHSSGCPVVASTESARAWAAGREQWEQFKNTRALQARSDICPACGKAEGEHSAGCPVVEFKANY